MPELIPDLWPKSIRAQVLSPSTVLRAQASALARNTSGSIKADIIEISRNDHKIITCAFDIFSPPIGYTERLFTFSYYIEKVYPAAITSKTFEEWSLRQISKPIEGIERERGQENTLRFFSQDTLILGLSHLFNHMYTVSSLESIMARCNEIGIPANAPEPQESSVMAIE